MVTTILFLCTDNAVLSPLAEAYVNTVGAGSVRAFSAGATPASRVSPTVFDVLRENGITATGLQPKSWQVFTMEHAPTPDAIFALQGGLVPQVAHAWPEWIPCREWLCAAPPMGGAGKGGIGKPATRTAFQEVRAASIAILDWAGRVAPSAAVAPLRRSA